MSTLKNLCILLSAVVVLFACKRKADEGGSSTTSPTENSYDLKDFVIQDAADATILDFVDQHKIVQHKISEVKDGVVDTIYAAVMVDLSSLKLKPRFYDVSRVTKVDPDTNELRDLNKYDDQDYPTMKVTFNTGVTRTFVIVMSKVNPNEDNLNLLLNQNIYFIKTYKLENNSAAITTYTDLKHTSNPPALLQTSIKDTIEIEVTTTDLNDASKEIVFTPATYGNGNNDTVLSTLTATPTSLSFMPNVDLDYKTMSITFANGFTREYAVKLNTVDPNIPLNRDKYWVRTFSVFNSANANVSSAITIDSLTHNIPQNQTLQKDTIVFTLSNAQYDNYPITLKNPFTWNADNEADNAYTYTIAPTAGVVFSKLADTNVYKTLTITFPSGFKREYAVKLHQEPKPLPTAVSFTAFSVAGTGVSYARPDTTGVSTNGHTLITDNDGIMIIRPLTGWTTARSVTLQFTGLESAVTATLAGYASETIGNTGASLSSDGKITIDFSTINSDSVKLTLTNTNPGGESKEYKIKLLSGKLKNPALILDGSNTIANYIGDNVDREFKIAVDENYTYVLTIRNTDTIAGSIAAVVLRRATYDLYAYPIQAGNTTPTTPIKMNTDGNIITDIVCFDNVLYGIAIANPTIANSTYQIFKWTAVNAAPIAIGSPTSSGHGAAYALFTANIDESKNINFYGVSATIGTNSPQITKISASINGAPTSETSVIFNKQIWQNTSISTGANYATFLDIPKLKTGIMVAVPGVLFGSDFEGGSGGATLKGFSRYAVGGNLNPQGANVEVIRDKYYFMNNGVYASTTSQGHRMNVMDLGKDLVATLNSITNANDFYAKQIFSGAMGVTFTANNQAFRGNCRTYRLSSGKVRIVSLVSAAGFKVWDME